MHAHFSIEESLLYGWHKTREHSGLLFQILLTLLGLHFLSAIINWMLQDTLLGFLAGIALSIVEFVIGVGFTFIALHIVEGKGVHYKQLVPPTSLVWRFFLAGLLVSLFIIVPMAISALALVTFSFSVAAVAGQHLFSILMLGFGGVLALVCLVCIVYANIRLSMVRFSVLEHEGVVHSLRDSAKMTRGVELHLLGFFFVAIVLNIVGAMLLLVGLLVSIPVTILAYAHIYQKLKAR